jgi:hypothetical protein
MTENERDLLRDLRTVAAQESRQAPPELEQRLLTEFRKRSRSRRLSAWLPAAGIAAIAAGLVLFVWLPKGADKEQAKALPTHMVEAPATVSADDSDEGFYPVPDADALPPVENAMVIRVEMTPESLRLMGFAVDEEPAADRMEADVLIGQDGLARGVRLVQ